MRTPNSKLVVPHQILAAMFGRRAVPRLELGIERVQRRTIEIHVRNNGEGTAHAPRIRFRIGEYVLPEPDAPQRLDCFHNGKTSPRGLRHPAGGSDDKRLAAGSALR